MQIPVRNVSFILFLSAAILVPLYFTNLRIPLGGLILRPADLLALFIIAIFVFCKYLNVVDYYLPKGFGYLGFFLLYCFINGLNQSGLFKAIVATVQWSIILGAFSIVYSQSVMHPEKFINIFIKALLIICCYVVAYHITHGHYMHYKALGDAKYEFGLTGVLILRYSFYFKDKKYLSALLILYPFILMSFERKGILSFHVVLFIYLLSLSKSMIKFGLLAGFAGLLISIFVAPDLFDFSNMQFFEYSNLEIFNLDEDVASWSSNYHRQSLLVHGWDIFINNWMFGVGPKMLPLSMLDYYFSPHLALYTHNVFLDTLIEQGVFGLLLLVLPYFIHFVSTRFDSIEQIIVFFAICVYSLIMLFFMSGGAPSMVLMYLPLLLSHVFSAKHKMKNAYCA